MITIFRKKEGNKHWIQYLTKGMLLGVLFFWTASVVQAAPVPTVTLTASKTVMLAGSGVGFTWSSSDAMLCTASSPDSSWTGVKATSGSSTINPTKTGTYSITCTGPGGTSAPSSVHLDIINTPGCFPGNVCVGTSISPPDIASGGSIYIGWINATGVPSSCVATSGPWPAAYYSSMPNSGFWNTGPLSADTTYRMKCGSKYSTPVTINVIPAPTVTFAATPMTVMPSQYTKLTWSSTNASYCTASGGWSGSKAVNSPYGEIIQVPSSGSQIYTITCTGTGGTSGPSSVTVNVVSGSGSYQDIGLRMYDGSSVVPIAIENSCSSGQPLRIGESGNVHCVTLVNSTDPNATNMRIYTPGGIKALRKYTSGGPAPAPEILDFHASASPIALGDSTTLVWTATNSTLCTASGDWSGNKVVNGSETRSPLVSGTYILTCVGPGGTSAPSSAVVTVFPAPSVSLTATPLSIASGNWSGLNLVTSNVSSCTVKRASDNFTIGSFTSGSTFVWPTSTETYIANCTGPTGATGSDSVTVTVAASPPPPTAPTVNLIASPTSGTSGMSSTLGLTTTNVTSCYTQAVYPNGSSSGVSYFTTGNQPVGPLIATGTYTYTTTCWGPGGSANDTATVVVGATPPPTVTISATPTSVSSGNSTMLTWSVSDATSCTGSGDSSWNGSKTASNGSHSQTLLNRTVTRTYSIQCTGSGGTSPLKSVTVTVGVSTPPPPTVTISATPAVVSSGGSSTLKWTTTGAVSCVASGGWSVPVSSGTNKTHVLVALSTTKTYVITCFNSAGVSASDAVAVVVTGGGGGSSCIYNGHTYASGQSCYVNTFRSGALDCIETKKTCNSGAWIDTPGISDPVCLNDPYICP